MSDEAQLMTILQRFDSEMEPLDEMNVFDAVSKLPRREAGAEANLKSNCELEAIAFAFCPDYTWKNEGRNSYYGPMFRGTDDAGKDVSYPDIQGIGRQAFEYWSKRSNEAKHPVLRARYADVCWEFQGERTGTKPAIGLAQVVIDSTVEATSRGLIQHANRGVKRLARALAVSISIRDETRIAAVRDAIVSYEDAIAREGFAGTWGFSFDHLIYNNKVPKTPELENKLVGSLEKHLAVSTSLKDGKPVDPWAAEAAALRLAGYFRRKNQTDDARRVLLEYGGAFEKAAETATGMVASGWLRMVHHHYVDFGMRSEAEQVLLKVKEYAKRSRSEMAAFSDSVEVPREEMEQFLQAIVEGDLATCLTKIAFNFVPKKGQIVDLLKSLRDKAPLSSIMPLTLVDKDGRPVASIGSVDDDLDGRVMHQLGQQLQFAELFLQLAVDRMIEVHKPKPEIIIDHLRQSPAFFEEQMPALNAGLRFYFTGDDLIATHLFIPQIEASIRHLIDRCKLNYWKAKRGGGLQLKNLDELLREPVIGNCFGEDIELYFRALLTDQRAWNLRNEVCHGIITPDSIGRRTTDRLFHVLLILSVVRNSPQAKGGTESE